MRGTVEQEEETRIRNDVINRLLWDDRVDETDIKVEVEVEGGIVRLTGTVPNQSARLFAESDALFTQGVTAVDNRLAVKPGDIEGVPADENIQAAIAGLFAMNAGLGGMRIFVSVRDGIVKLDGSVDTLWKKNLAQDLASHVIGVLNIYNNLSIAPLRQRSDEDIARDIRDALERNTGVDGRAVHVAVSDGAVTLTGRAPDRMTYNMIENTAGYTRGVLTVRNEMNIGDEARTK